MGELARPLHQRAQRCGEAGKQEVSQQKRDRQRGGGQEAAYRHDVTDVAVERRIRERGLDPPDLLAVDANLGDEKRFRFGSTREKPRQPAGRFHVALVRVQQGAAALIDDAQGGDGGIGGDLLHVVVQGRHVVAGDHAAHGRFDEKHEVFRHLLLRFQVGLRRLARKSDGRDGGGKQQKQGKGDGNTGAQGPREQPQANHPCTVRKRGEKRLAGSVCSSAVLS